ncbi:MAG: tetratricopeptide repeat protein [Candidatus Nitrosotenuis sp.]
MSELFDSAILEFNLGNFKKAPALFSQVLEVEPHNVTALIKKGNILGKYAKYQDAIIHYDTVLGIEPKNSLALVNKGLALHYLGQYNDAISCYDTILEDKPKSALVLYNKASSMVRNNQVNLGLETLSKAIQIDFSYKYKARSDADFEEIRKTNEFKKIIL